MDCNMDYKLVLSAEESITAYIHALHYENVFIVYSTRQRNRYPTNSLVPTR